MENLDLFTPVEEFKAEPYKFYTVAIKYQNGEIEEGYKQYSPETGFFDENYWCVTHVLDLSKLTTKGKAIELVANCVMFPDKTKEFIESL